MVTGATTAADYAAIMDGLAKEMHVLTLQALNIESSLTGLSLRDCSQPELVHDLQLVDLLLQHMAELRTFMATLASGLQYDSALCLDRALDGVRLHAVQGRLAESLGRAVSHAQAGGAGDFEML
jgi:hypothetical protein